MSDSTTPCSICNGQGGFASYKSISPRECSTCNGTGLQVSRLQTAELWETFFQQNPLTILTINNRNGYGINQGYHFKWGYGKIAFGMTLNEALSHAISSAGD